MPETILTTEAPVTTTTPDNVVEALVGDGKPYKTVEDLAKGKLNADIHIQRVELENKELREKVASAKTVDDLLDQIKAKTALENIPQDVSNLSPVTSGGLTAEQVAKIVADNIQGHEKGKKAAENKARAEAKLREVFGDKAGEVFAKEANTPELRANLIQLAEINPEMFVSMFVKETPNSNIDTGANGKLTPNLNLNPNPSLTPGTQAYYSNLRKTNPKLYNSAATQVEMHSAALRDPDKYFGRKTA